jgi:hypothetical protein
MRHYALDQWIDFTRELAAPEERARMAEHLATGCDRCRRDADFCAQVNHVCQRLETQHVPEYVTRLARAIFPFRVAEPGRGTRLPIEVLFDSFLVPAPGR